MKYSSYDSKIFYGNIRLRTREWDSLTQISLLFSFKKWRRKIEKFFIEETHFHFNFLFSPFFLKSFTVSFQVAKIPRLCGEKKSKYKKNHDRSWVFFRAGWEINSFERGILSFFSSSYSCILNNIVMWSVVIVSL